MFKPSFKLNDRVTKQGRTSPMLGTVMGINGFADVFQVLWDGIGTADPAWYTAQSLQLDKPTHPGYSHERAAAYRAQDVLNTWNALPRTPSSAVGDRVQVLVETTEGYATSYEIVRGVITASKAHGCQFVVLTDDSVYISSIADRVKGINRGF